MELVPIHVTSNSKLYTEIKLTTDELAFPGDPAYSRNLDVHRWSDHEEVNLFIDDVYEELLMLAGNHGIRKRHWKVVLLDLYVCWCFDPEMSISVSMDNNSYRAKTRYNALHISKMTIQIVHSLIDMGYVYHKSGFYDPVQRKGRMTRIKPSEKLIELFRKARFSLFDIGRAQQELVVLRDAEKNDIEYDDTELTNDWRDLLLKYNGILSDAFIDIPSLEHPRVDLDKKFVSIDQRQKVVRRVFNDSSWSKGGRFYGGFWQQLPKEWRSKLWINDEPVCELDFKAIHPMLLYALEGIDYGRESNRDIYDYLPKELQCLGADRSYAKSLFLMAINADTEQKSFQAFREANCTKYDGRLITDASLSMALSSLRDTHKPIQHHLCTGVGLDLMNRDAEIMERVLGWFVRNGEVALCIHDSVIVPMRLKDKLRFLMEAAYKKVTGCSVVWIDENQPTPVVETEDYRRRRAHFKAWLDYRRNGT